MVACWSWMLQRRGPGHSAYLNLDDTLFTLKLTPNLAHCLSVYGIAREVSALTGLRCKAAAFPCRLLADKLPVKVSAPDLCGRFSGRIVRNVNTRAATPQWMLDRLARCGQRACRRWWIFPTT